MTDKAYSVEYVPPKDTAAILRGLFAQVQERLAASLPQGMLDASPREVSEKDNSYDYVIPLGNDRGHIYFSYDDEIAEMASFEEYMHSGWADRGRLWLRITLKLAGAEEAKCRQALKELAAKDIQDISPGRGTLSVSQICDACLLRPDENDVNWIYESVMKLWRQLELVLEKAGQGVN